VFKEKLFNILNPDIDKMPGFFVFITLIFVDIYTRKRTVPAP